MILHLAGPHALASRFDFNISEKPKLFRELEMYFNKPMSKSFFLFERFPSIGSLILILLLAQIYGLSAQIVLTEVMFDADTLEYHNEYVEIYNSGDAAVDLNGWSIGDSLELDKIIGGESGSLLAAGQFAVILDASYFENSTTYDSIIPSTALILTIDDGSFGSFGWANSESEPVYLTNPMGDTVQLYRYSPDNQPGYSDEKIFCTEDNSASNWANSIRFRGTPGFLNSVSPPDWDLSVDSLWTDPVYPLAEIGIQVNMILKNRGREPIQDCSIVLFDDLNENSLPEESEIITSQNFSRAINWSDTVRLNLNIDGLLQGKHRLGIQAILPSDQRPENNIRIIEISVEDLQNPIILNEIMYRPLPGNQEWVELYNRGEYSINLKGWTFADARDTVVLATKDHYLPAQNYLIVSKDSAATFQYGISPDIILIVKSMPVLNNDQDDVKLCSVSGRLIDRVNYSDAWMRRETDAGISLERINPEISSQLADNWAACTDPKGSTPGKENSIFVSKISTQSSLSITPNPFSPDNDGYEDYTLIQYRLPAATSYITLDIYDILGRRLRRLSNMLPVGQEGQLIWDGRDDNGRMCRIGIYIVLCRIFESSRNLSKEFKTTVALVKR